MQFEINAKTRTLQGSGASRRLRRADKVPAVVYGGAKPAQSIELDHNEIYLALRKEAFHASIINLNVDGAKEPVLLRDTQMHPYKRIVMHIDFQRIDPKEKLHIKVPLHFINADIAPGVKLSGGNVNHGVNELDISCLPGDLPEFIEVDLQGLNLGQSLHASEVKLPKGVTLITHGTEDQVVVSIAGKKAETEATGEEGAAAGETA